MQRFVKLSEEHARLIVERAKDLSMTPADAEAFVAMAVHFAGHV